MDSFVEDTPTAVWQHIGILSKYTGDQLFDEVIGLYTELLEIYPQEHRFSEHGIQC
ncbi:22093_t:CDS:2 [Entrophospora sp. SA101]|nr:22093_t:CDS:2 [Entrophospora sp. SA101]CAJ0836005.1 13471_t:CDS:2 [Entrophospora sp. SA101]